MWRSGLFWRFFGVTAGLLLAGGLLTGLMITQFAPLDGTQGEVFRRQVWAAVGLVEILGLVLALLLIRRLIYPLHELAQGARQIAAGDYGKKVFTHGPDEVNVLARSMNRTSERLAAQFAQLDDERQQLRAVLGSMVEGVIAIDANQHILFANERAAQLLEFTPNVAVGRRLWEMVRHRPLHEAINAVLEQRAPHQQEWTWHGARVKSLTVHASPLPGSPPRGAVLVIHDTTELRRLERLRQEFVANVSHELKTPLAVIKANVETLLDGAMDDVSHRGLFLQRIAEQADQLHNLILDLLSLARIEAEAESFVLQAVPVARVVQACLQNRRTLLEEKGHRLEVEGPPEPVTAWVDEEALLQILDNLIDNAIKYTPERGNLWVRWRREQEQIVIVVQDNGMGIPQKDLPRIFERFYRVDKARSRQLGGTGLGLSIVKHLLQAMQGSVKAESTLRVGSTFTVWLPANPTT
jgi:two-component system phosphate regulon sensor histidine kinase PhoR